MAYNNHLKIPFSKTQIKAVSTDGVPFHFGTDSSVPPLKSSSLSSKGFSVLKK